MLQVSKLPLKTILALAILATPIVVVFASILACAAGNTKPYFPTNSLRDLKQVSVNPRAHVGQTVSLEGIVVSAKEVNSGDDSITEIGLLTFQPRYESVSGGYGFWTKDYGPRVQVTLPWTGAGLVEDDEVKIFGPVAGEMLFYDYAILGVAAKTNSRIQYVESLHGYVYQWAGNKLSPAVFTPIPKDRLAVSLRETVYAMCEKLSTPQGSPAVPNTTSTGEQIGGEKGQ